MRENDDHHADAKKVVADDGGNGGCGGGGFWCCGSCGCVPDTALWNDISLHTYYTGTS